MKKRLFLLFAVLGLITWTGILFYRSQKSADLSALLHKTKSAIGSDEDPAARAKYEWMRLRDPATGQIPPNIRAKELAFAKKLPTKEAVGSLKKLGKAVQIQTQAWSARGPFIIGGRTRALAVDITNENIILAGGTSGGMWQSTDGGVSWNRTTGPAQLPSATCVVQDNRPGKTNIWYYGTGELLGNTASGGAASYRGDGVFKSTNGGISWEQLPSTVSGTPHRFDQMFDYVWNLALDPSNFGQDEIYAATYGGLKRSVDGGISWATVFGDSSLEASYFTDVAVTSTGVVYAALSEYSFSGSSAKTKGIFRSPDGINWTRITPSSWPDTYRRIVIGISPSNENIVYFLGNTPGHGFLDHSLWKYTYISGNGSGSGGVWEDRSANIPAFAGDFGDFDSQDSYDLVIKVKPDNENVVFIGGTNLYRSTDGFATKNNTAWIGGYSPNAEDPLARDWVYDNHHPDQHAIVFLPSNSLTLFSSHDGGVSKTTNCMADVVAWAYLNNGYKTTQFYTIAIDRATSGNEVIIGGMQDWGTWLTNQASQSAPWIMLSGGDGSFAAIANGRSSYYISGQHGIIFRALIDDGGNLSAFTRVDPAGGSGYIFINPYVLDPNNTNVMYLAGGDRLWRNSDLTAIPLSSLEPTSVNWSMLANSVVAGASITALGMSRTPANRLYYGTGDGKIFRLDEAHAGDPIPINVWSGQGFPVNAYMSCLTVDPADGNHVLAVFSNYNVQSLFHTTNGGTSWIPIGGNLEQNPDGSGNGPSLRYAAILPFAGAKIYFVAASTGLYSTTTLNATSTIWAQEGTSTIGNVVVDMIDTRESDGLVVAATHGNGVFSTNLTTSVNDFAAEPPADFALHQNHPNPFNAATKIGFYLPRDQQVSLSIYNLLGKKVRDLRLHERYQTGYHEVIFDSNDDEGQPLPSGVYQYRLNAGQFVAVKKLLLVK